MSTSECEPKFIELDSSYRDRSVYPLPTDYEVVAGNPSTNIISAVSDQLPIREWRGYGHTPTGAGGTGFQVDLGILESSEDPIGGLNAQFQFLAYEDAGTEFIIEQEGYYTGMVGRWRRNDGLWMSTLITDFQYIGKFGGNSIGLFTVDRPMEGDFGDASQVFKPFSISDSSGLTNGTQEISVFIPYGSPYDDAYVGYLLWNEPLAEGRRIIKYDGETRLAQIDTTESIAAWNEQAYYCLRKEAPSFTNTVVGGTTTTVILPASFSSVDGTYVGYYIRSSTVADPTFRERLRVIGYDGATRTVTVENPGFSSPIATDFELMTPRDAYYPFIASVSSGQSSFKRYKIELIALRIPDQVVKGSVGGSLNNYPYVILELSNGNKGRILASTSIYSNNPNTQALRFICPILDARKRPNKGFFNLDAGDMVLYANVDITSGFGITVRLPNHEVVEYRENPFVESSPPIPPVPEMQTTVTLKMTPLSRARYDPSSKGVVHKTTDIGNVRLGT